MNRSLRTFLVVGIAVGLAAVATYLVYRAIQNRPRVEVEVAHAFAVVASHPLPLGAKLTADDVKLIPWPAANQVPGGFEKIEDVVDRGVIAPLAENEPLTGNNVAAKDAGAGLPPTIPPGMRAISVKVNEVIGVAGFVVPGTRVDVMAIVRDNTKSLARVVVSNVQVLAAGTRYDQAMAREGQAVPSSVVTLMVSPSDAELIGLASTEGQLMLTLRNPLDSSVTPSTGTLGTKLVGDAPPPKPAATGAPARRVAPPPTPTPEAPAPPKPPVETIKGGVIKKEIIK